MKQNEHADERLELYMSRLLIGGVMASGLLLIAGGAVYLARHGFEVPRYSTFGGEPARFISLSSIFTEVFAGSGRAVIMLGILVLIGTPIARIIFAVVGFALEKDRLYTVISMLVLCIILASLLGGLAG